MVCLLIECFDLRRIDVAIAYELPDESFQPPIGFKSIESFPSIAYDGRERLNVNYSGLIYRSYFFIGVVG